MVPPVDAGVREGASVVQASGARHRGRGVRHRSEEDFVHFPELGTTAKLPQKAFCARWGVMDVISQHAVFLSKPVRRRDRIASGSFFKAGDPEEA